MSVKKILASLLLPAFALAHETEEPHAEACGFVFKNLSIGYWLAFAFMLAVAAYGFRRFWKERKKGKTVWSWMVLGLAALLSAAIQYYGLPCA
jgi:hypothetical protein